MTVPPKPVSDAPQPGERLAKRIAEMVPCSRREAEQYIAGGWVRVDGQVVEEPQFRVLKQKVELDKNASLMAVTQVTLLLHKPPGYDDGGDAGVDPHAARHANPRSPRQAPRSARQCWRGAISTRAGRQCWGLNSACCKGARRWAWTLCSATTVPPTRLNFSR